MARLFADIDDCKRVNDTLGPDAGDEVLVQFSNRIRDVMERNDQCNDTLARFGGDEFVILLELHADSELDIHSRTSRLAPDLVLQLAPPILVRGRQAFARTQPA